MFTPSDSRVEQDDSQETWSQRGVNLLEERKHDSEVEEKLRRRMRHSVMHEMHFWLGMMWIVMLFFNSGKPGNDPINYMAAICAVVFFAAAIDGAAAKRTQAILRWIDHRQGGDKPVGRNTGLI